MRTNRARREALNAALDHLVEGSRPSGGDDELLVAAARARAAMSVRVPPAVRDRHVARATEIEPALVGGTAPSQGRRSRAWTIGIATAALLSLSTSSAVAASSSAVPGDMLYPVKRAVERVRLAAPGGEGTKARLHLTFAAERLDELQELLARRAAGENVDVGAAMSAYAKSLAKAERDIGKASAKGRVDEDLLAHVLAQIDKHVQRLTILRDERVPEQARDAIQRAIDNAEKAKGRVGRGEGGGPPEEKPGKGKDNAPGQLKRSGAPAGS